jgi:ankyrin repeat protein
MKVKIDNSINKDIIDINQAELTDITSVKRSINMISPLSKSKVIPINSLIHIVLRYITSDKKINFYYLLKYNNDQILDSIQIVKSYNNKKLDITGMNDTIIYEDDKGIEFEISFLPPILMAIKYNNNSVINKYIMNDNPRLINQTSQTGENILHYAIMYGLDNKIIYRILHQKGANVLLSSTSALNTSTETPLDFAIKFQPKNVILLTMLVNLKAFTLNESRLLQLFLIFLSVDNSYRFKDEINSALKKLILENTNRFFTYQKILNFTNTFGFTPLIMSIRLKNNVITNFIIDLLPPESINQQTDIGTTALFYVDDLSLFKKLISKGADINITDNYNDNLLHRNIGVNDDKKCNIDIVKYILSSDTFLKEKIDQQNIYGNTPLHEAFKIKNIPIILQLIKYGADLTIKNKDGKTPLTINPSATKKFNDLLINVN